MPFVICTLGSLFYVYDYFLAVAPSMMTQDLLHNFGLSAGKLGALLAAFFLASTFFQIPAGMLLDRYGARKLLSLSVLISGLGTLCFAAAHSGWQLAFARLLMGIGSPFAFLGALYLASRWFKHRYFALIAGLVQVGATVGSIIGGAPLALLVNALGWRQGLWLVGWATLVLALLFWLIIRDGPTENRGKPRQQANMRLSETFRLPQVWWISLIGFASWVTVTGIGSLWGIPYLMTVYQVDNKQTGLFYIIFWLGLGLGSPFIGWLSQVWRSRKLPACLCFGTGFIASLIFIEAAHIPEILIGVVLFFLGFAASAQSLTFGIAKDIVPPAHFAAVSGLINLAAVATGIVVQPLMGYLIDWHARLNPRIPAHGIYHVNDYQTGFLLVSAVLLLGLMVSGLMLDETRCITRYEEYGPVEAKKQPG